VYRSKTMSDAKCNYDIHDKELLAIVQAFHEWKRCTRGNPKPIRVLTNHKNLVTCMTTKELNERQARWMQELSQYNFKIEYRAGKERGKPDALTRREGDLPTAGDKRLTRNVGILLQKERYWDIPEGEEIKLDVMETTEFHDKDEWEIQKASNVDNEVPDIKKNLDEGRKEMKGIALGLCQWKNGLLWYQGKIWIPKDEGIRTTLIAKHHEPPQAGHGGMAKTTKLISRRYYWPKIREDNKRFIKNCDTCQSTKVVRHAPYGLLHANKAPDRPWKSMAMDFITDLPKSEVYDTILVVIDRLTRMSHFIRCSKDLDAQQFTNLFMKEIVRLHRLPHEIITDRGTLFTSDLWNETTGKLGIERRLRTAFHTQTDGQTERTNAILEQYLRAYINYQQDDWCCYLPLAEFAYNNGYQETIKNTPFFANYRINPEYEMIGQLMQGKQTKPEVVTQLHESLRNEMVAAQLRQKEFYDLHRKPDPNLQSGDMVWLLPRNIKTTRPSKKLDYKKIRPLKILAKIGTSAYTLALPPSMAIHNTFHISLLEAYQDN